MKKRLITRGLLGAPLGIAISFVITLIISICIGDGSFYPVTPELLGIMKNELSAVILQTILSGILGSGFGMASIIWEVDSWSIAKQTGIYFAAVFVILMPIAYLANWMPHSISGVLSYAALFVAIFVFVWLIQYCAWKVKVKKMNTFVKKNNRTN